MPEPSRDIADLDHIMLNTFDSARSERLMRRLGFVIRPAREFEVMGGGKSGGRGNSFIVMLRSARPDTANFFEFSLLDRPFAHPAMVTILDGAEGFAMAVHAGPDTDALERRWRALGLDAEHWKFEMAGNEAIKPARIQILMPLGRQLPFNVNCVQWTDLDQYRIERFMEHPNTAERYTRLTCIAPDRDFEPTVARYVEVLGFEPDRGEEGAVDFRAGAVALRIMANGAFKAAYPGVGDALAVRAPCGAALTILTRSIPALTEILDRNGVAYARFGDRVCVDPHEAGGIMMEFVPLDA